MTHAPIDDRVVKALGAYLDAMERFTPHWGLLLAEHVDAPEGLLLAPGSQLIGELLPQVDGRRVDVLLDKLREGSASTEETLAFLSRATGAIKEALPRLNEAMRERIAKAKEGTKCQS